MLRLRHGFFLALGLLATTILPVNAFGQGGSDGSIIGYVFDQTGAPLQGIKITATSPTQIGGSRTTYSNEEGMFRVRQLFPGTFQVTASAPKLKTVIQKDIRVGITSAAEVNLVMEVQTQGVEEVKVVEKAPTVSTTTTNVKEVYDLDFVESMPFNSRDQVFNQMVNQIGGAVNGRIRGGASNQTIFTQDGFDMRDNYPVTKSSAAYEIQSAGYGADNATAAGGIVNLVTKTGSNKWEFEFNGTYEDDWTRFGKDSRDTPGNFYYVVNPAVAGPIVKDKVWFALAFESHYLGRGRDPDVAGVATTPKEHIKGINKGTLKVTWQINGRNKLTYLNNMDSAWNLRLKNDLGTEADSQQNRRAGPSGLWGLIWEALLTDDLVFRSQVAYTQRPQYWYPIACEKGELGECDITPGVINNQVPFGSSATRFETVGTARGCDGTGDCSNGTAIPHRRLDLYVWQAFNRLQYFVDSKALGEHSLVLKHQFYTEKEITRTAQPGDYYTENGLSGNDPSRRYFFYSNDPRYEDPRYGWWIGTDVIYRNNASFSDAWRPTRHLTVTPAISYVWSSGENSASPDKVNAKAWAPSVAVAWDATHDGRTVLRGSYSQYVDVAIRNQVLHTLGDQVRRMCLLDNTTGEYTRNCEYSGGAGKNTLGLPCGPNGVDPSGTPCRTALKTPRTIEYTMGGEREVVEGLALGLDMVYRQYNNQYEQNETNRIWNASATEVIGYRNGRNETILDMGTPDGAKRSYRGVTLSLNKRQGRLRTYASYTLSQLRGTVFNGHNNPWGDIPGRNVFLDGPGADDRLHDLKLSANWSVTNYLSFGFRYNFYTGGPYERLFRNPGLNAYEERRAVRGTNPGTNLNDPADDRELRYPAVQDVNAHVRLSMLPLIGHRLDFYVDALNIMNLRTVTAYGQNQGQNFGNETGWLAPFRVRFGLDYKY
jgi:hypothetical protein